MRKEPLIKKPIADKSTVNNSFEQDQLCSSNFSVILRQIKSQIMSKSNSEKYKVLADLMQMAKADNEVSEAEVQFLINIAAQMDVSHEELKQVLSGEIKGELPATEIERIVHFHSLVLFMNVDEKTDEKELVLIRDMGIKMGLNPDATNEVLRIMKFYPNNVVPPKKLIKIFRRNLN